MALTAIDKAIGPVAKDLIKNFGKAVTFEQTKNATYSTTTGAVTDANTSHEIYAIVGTSRRGQESSGETANNRVLTIAGDGLDFEPTEGMAVKIDNVRYRVSLVEAVYSGSAVATYSLTVHR